jgi:hypothetical protein
MAVEHQLAQHEAGRVFSRHLLSFISIRFEHDRVYTEVAFSSTEERERIEQFSVPNLQFVNRKNGERDKEMRQKTRGQSAGQWVAVSTKAAPASRYLQGLCSVLDPLLKSLDEMLTFEPTSSEEKVKEQVKRSLGARMMRPP